LAELIGSDTDSNTFADVLAALASMAGAMILVRAVGDETLSESHFHSGNTLARIALGRSGDVAGRRM
jgi:hypothetical protein